MKRYFNALLLGISLLFWVQPALAHNCASLPVFNIEVGETALLWLIEADRLEDLTQYTALSAPEGVFANALPNGNFNGHHGVFVITGLAEGTS